MALHHELLALATALANRSPNAPVEADLRRGVSSAYYALFHLLVHEGATWLVAIAAVRPRLVRAFYHKKMKDFCQDYARLTPITGQLKLAGQLIPQGLKNIASECVALQQARHQADYDTAAVVTQGQAQTDVMRAELAFLDWEMVQADPVAERFLGELLFRGIPRR